MPMLRENQVKEVDYSSFMTMTENKEIDKVQVEQDKILFTKKDDKQAYKTAIMNDPELVERLHKSGADFTGGDRRSDESDPVGAPLMGAAAPHFLRHRPVHE